MHLTDEQVIQSHCRVGRDFAIVLQGNTTDVERAWPALEGIVRFVSYSVVGDDFGQPVHVGDAYSLEAAREVMRRLTFETGLYSRCWEISCAHLSEAAYRHLEALADSRESRDSIIAAFRIPGSPAIGIKLIATPWTDANLHSIFGLSAHQLRQEHIAQGMPPRWRTYSTLPVRPMCACWSSTPMRAASMASPSTTPDTFPSPSRGSFLAERCDCHRDRHTAGSPP